MRGIEPVPDAPGAARPRLGAPGRPAGGGLPGPSSVDPGTGERAESLCTRVRWRVLGIESPDGAGGARRGESMSATKEQVAILYRSHAGWIQRRCRRILGSDEAALDAVQEVFARAFRHWDTWDGTASRATWLGRIALHHCLNEVRNARTRAALLDARTEEATPGAPTAPDADVGRRDALRAAMAGMDEDLVKVAVLYYLDDLTQAEVAEELGISVPTVRKRLDLFLERARTRLRAGGRERAIARALGGLALLAPALPLLALLLRGART